ncbi:aminotransferase class III-fold pyridoxal phosphate-dependent enzyme [Acinetobacter haemolyticus]|nr:aminotransferase class III-fold pyridoxal phosphate-dependent enzyme [Acinetobacter haemolyticus]
MSSHIEIESELLIRRQHALGQSPLFYREPLHLVRGEGIYLFGADGTRYLDCYNNIPIVGHCHPQVIDAMTTQAKILNVHSRYLSENIVAYAERLLETFQSRFDQVIFTCSGSEANDQALRIVRMVSQGQGIICSNYAYHGNTTIVDRVSPLFQHQHNQYDDVRMIPFPELYRPLNGLSGEELCQAYLDQVQQQIDYFKAKGIGFAGIILCSLFANEGIPNVPQGLLAKITTLVHAAGGLVIADEVQAGFGRTGTMWGHEAMGFTPDIVTIGKPMGNGYPVAALISRADILDQFRRDNFYFNTFAGAQIAAATANAVLDILEQDQLLTNATQVGNYLRTHLNEFSARHTLIGDVRGMGLWVGFELVSDLELKTPATAQTDQLINDLKDLGVLVSKMGPYNNVLKIRPPLIFNLDNANELLEKLDLCLGKI